MSVVSRTPVLLAIVIVLLGNALPAYASTTEFRPERFFSGHTRSVGVFRNNIGKREQHFTTDCHGRTRGDTLWLDQRFRYDDGHTQERHWQIRRLADNHYVGRANDVVGEARGMVSGATFRFSYVVALKPGNPLFNVRLDQTLMLRRDGSVENDATIHKLGIPLSRIHEEFRRLNSEQGHTAASVLFVVK